MLTAASCLSEQHEVSMFWDNGEVLQKATDRFGLDLRRVQVEKNIFSPAVSFWQRIKKSKDFDAIFYLSDGSLPFVFSKRLYIHFQFPVEWVSRSGFVNKIKMSRVTKVICNSSFTKDFIDKKFGIESLVIYPPASGETQIGKEEKKNMILTVGRYEKMDSGKTFKKHEDLINAFKAMIKSGLKDWKLVIVVSFREEDADNILELEKGTKSFPITFVKNASNKELTKLYAQAKIYWHAAGFGENLRVHPERAEHFGIATVQAMEQGAVPVVIDSGGQKEIIANGEDGELWLTEDVLIAKTMEVIKKPSLWKKLSENAKIKAKRFSREMFCEQISGTVV